MFPGPSNWIWSNPGVRAGPWQGGARHARPRRAPPVQGAPCPSKARLAAPIFALLAGRQFVARARAEQSPVNGAWEGLVRNILYYCYCYCHC